MSDTSKTPAGASSPAPDGYAGYHPDPDISAEIEAESAESERLDLKAGYPPRWWQCPQCGASHGRGHFESIGTHRCLGCGYAGGGGLVAETREGLRHISGMNDSDRP